MSIELSELKVTPAQRAAAEEYKQMQRDCRRRGYRTLVEMFDAVSAPNEVYDSLFALHQNATYVLMVDSSKKKRDERANRAEAEMQRQEAERIPLQGMGDGER